jgi:hypothetical protein
MFALGRIRLEGWSKEMPGHMSFEPLRFASASPIYLAEDSYPRFHQPFIDTISMTRQAVGGKKFRTFNTTGCEFQN